VALLSGILRRHRGHEKDGKLRALRDCMPSLQAQKLALVVLTANVSGYDILPHSSQRGGRCFAARNATAAEPVSV